MKEKAVVVQSTGSWYEVITDGGRRLPVRLRGKFRKGGLHLQSNPVAVGDHVSIALDDSGEAVISEIHPRENFIVRRSARSRRHRHIVAANIDQALLIITLASPRTSYGFIDRFLVNAGTYHIPVLLIFNKADLLDHKTTQKQVEMQALYESLGHKCLVISALLGEGTEEVREALANKVNLLAGHSGVGKSTLVNAIEPGLELKVSDISKRTGKGMHTTTFATMHPLSIGGYLVDTPGLKEFGIVDLEEREVGHYFVEFVDRLPHCRFKNCLHTDEPGCAVLEAVVDQSIALSRYESYLSILDDVRSGAKKWE